MASQKRPETLLWLTADGNMTIILKRDEFANWIRPPQRAFLRAQCPSGARPKRVAQNQIDIVGDNDAVTWRFRYWPKATDLADHVVDTFGDACFDEAVEQHGDIHVVTQERVAAQSDTDPVAEKAPIDAAVFLLAWPDLFDPDLR
jgi:hypothetical protein